MTPGDANLDVRRLCSLVVDSSPCLLRCIRFLDVHIVAVDWIASLVHGWFP